MSSVLSPPMFLIGFAVLATTARADEAPQPTTSRQLAVGESLQVKVVAKEKFNPTGLKVAAGQHYSFVVAKEAKWTDLSIECDAGGWKSEQAPALTRGFITKAEKDRRVPAADWFELIGTVGKDEQQHFQIGKRGTDWTYTAPVDGALFLFANDLDRMYGNNRGHIEVTITRVPQPAKQELPKNPPQSETSPESK